MKKFLIAFMLLIATTFASAQFIPTAPASAPNKASPTYIMPPGKIYVNLATLRKRRIAYSAPRIGIIGGSQYPILGTTSGGAFRVVCDTSHVAFDDPIVFPSQPGKTHLHVFFGNNATSSASDLNNMSTNGSSTCGGGNINRTGYWVPPLIYSCPAGSTGCTRSRDGEIQYPGGNNAYYKSDCCYNSTNNNAIVMGMQWPPQGLRMIAGDPNNTAVLDGGIAKFACAGPNPSFGIVDHIPTTAEANAVGSSVPVCGGTDANGFNNNYLNMLVYFPDCWAGVVSGSPVLDSPDHKSHMTYADAFTGCTTKTGFPVLFPTISYNVTYNIKSNADLDFLRLSSDQPRAAAIAQNGVWGCATAAKNWCAGASAHGDWVMGWPLTGIVVPGITGTVNITNAILDNCLRPPTGTRGIGYDCGNNVLGHIDPAHPSDNYWLY